MKKFLIQHEHEFIDNTNIGDASEYDLNSRLLLQWAFHIAKGMQYLARMHIMHGDLAARNILIGTGRNVTFACFYFSTTFLFQTNYTLNHNYCHIFSSRILRRL